MWYICLLSAVLVFKNQKGKKERKGEKGRTNKSLRATLFMNVLLLINDTHN